MEFVFGNNSYKYTQRNCVVPKGKSSWLKSFIFPCLCGVPAWQLAVSTSYLVLSFIDIYVILLPKAGNSLRPESMWNSFLYLL